VSLVVIEEHGPVALLRLNRPEKLNALSTALERELEEALDDARVRAAGAVVIAGNERAFSAGADMSEMGETGAAGALAYYRDTGGVYERIARLPQPTIAASVTSVRRSQIGTFGLLEPPSRFNTPNPMNVPTMKTSPCAKLSNFRTP